MHHARTKYSYFIPHFLEVMGKFNGSQSLLILRWHSVFVDQPDILYHYLKAFIKRTTSATSPKVIAGPIGKLNSSSAIFSVIGRLS